MIGSEAVALARPTGAGYAPNECTTEAALAIVGLLCAESRACPNYKCEFS
jgi:hypothetical protein